MHRWTVSMNRVGKAAYGKQDFSCPASLQGRMPSVLQPIIFQEYLVLFILLVSIFITDIYFSYSVVFCYVALVLIYLLYCVYRVINWLG